MQPDGRAVNVFVAFFNSTVVAVVATALALVVCSMMAYALARLPFRGSAVVLAAIVLMMLVPTEVILVPLFKQFAALGLLNTYGALIIPHVVSLFGVVLLRQFIANLPVELTEAAKIDGANAWQNYRYIVLPLIRPGLATLGILVSSRRGTTSCGRSSPPPPRACRRSRSRSSRSDPLTGTANTGWSWRPRSSPSPRRCSSSSSPSDSSSRASATPV
nr:hypothetical protein GCM10025732_26420 [Glycomyces mayteni]